jgi:NAD+ diphosphatase
MNPQKPAATGSSAFAEGDGKERARFDLGPRPDLGYTESRVDRAAERRSDAAYLLAVEKQDGAGAYAIAGELVVMAKHSGGLDPLFAPSAARALGKTSEVIFLGLHGDAPRFGVGLDRAAVDALKARDDLELSDLRSIAVQGTVAPEHLPPLAEAKAMLHWHARHRFCSHCGAPTQVLSAGWKRECAACKTEHFPRTDPVVIMLAIDGDRCLLGRQARFAQGTWSCLAGFVEPGETIEEAARREILEEAGVVCGEVKYFRSQPWPFPMSLMIGCHARAASTSIVVDRTELDDARWFDRKEAALMLARRHPDGLNTPPPIAIAHHIIRAFVEAGEDVLR